MAEDIQPIFILPEDSRRTSGKNAQIMNIQAARLVADTVKSTLGPKGMDKLLVDSVGEVVVTNDGVTILKEMNIENPSAKMIVEIAKTQENEVGDGTTTAVIIAGELLKNSESLLKKNIHPTIITKGFRLANEKAQELLNEMAVKVSDDETLLNIATTAMTGKGAEYSKEKLANIAVEAVKLVHDNNITNIKLVKTVEGSVDDTELIDGIVFENERVHSSMPSYVENAKITLIDASLEVKITETESKIQISSPLDMQAYINQEENMLKNMVDKIVDSGADVVFCQKGIEDIVQHFLARKGIFAVRRIKKSDMEKLSRATGANIISNIDSLSKKDVGYAGIVEEKKSGNENMVFVKNCKDPGSVTILIKGGTEHVVAEVKRAVEDALGDVASTLKNKKAVAGAGASEIELSRKLIEFANTLSGKEKLAVEAFAKSLEVIPLTLAENAGLNPIDILTSMKVEHDKGNKLTGIDVFSGDIINSWEKGIIEPLKIKTQALSSATEVAIMILRIDDIITAGKPDQRDDVMHGIQRM